MKIVKHLFLFLLLLFVSTPLWSQRGMRFDKITINDGLSQNTATCFLQDRKGLIWIGTQNGLNLYQGSTFQLYKSSSNSLNSLSDNFILSLFEDHEGFIWIGTQGGLNKLDPRTQQFTRYKHNEKDKNSLSDNYVYTIFEDAKHTIWVGTRKGLNLIDKKTGDFERFYYQGDKNLPQSIINDIVETNKHKSRLWLATDVGVLEFDREKRAFKQKIGYQKKHTVINVLAVDKKSRIWVGSEKGLFQITPGKKKDYYGTINNNNQIKDLIIDQKEDIWLATQDGGLKRVKPKKKHRKGSLKRFINVPANPFSISSNRLVSVFEDEAGILWIGTDGAGINKHDRYKSKFGLYDRNPGFRNSLSHNSVLSVCQDVYGKLWIGTEEGLTLIQHKTRKFVNTTQFGKDKVKTVFETSSGHIWIGTEENGLTQYRGNGRFLGLRAGFSRKYKHNSKDSLSISSNDITAIYEDYLGTIWIGTENGLNKFNEEDRTFTHYQYQANNPQSLSNNKIRGIYADNEGFMWVSTYEGGLNRFDAETETFINFKNDLTNTSSLSTNRVFSVYQENDSSLWVSTYGGGLNKMDKKQGTFRQYTEVDGLPNDVVYGLVADESGDLWFSSNRGIVRFDTKNEDFKKYSIENGLQGEEFNQGAIYKNNKTGEMFFGGLKGLNYFLPDSVKGNQYQSKTVFTAFKIFNKDVLIDENSVLKQHISETQSITLKHKQNNFSFEFASLHYSAPEFNRYAYKMEGFDPDWIYSEQGAAKYTNLDAGTYTFLVKGSNSDGVWNEIPSSIKITIIPPLYQRTWFILSIIVLIILIAYGLERLRMRGLRRDKEILEEKVRERTLALQEEKEYAEQQKQLLEVANVKITSSIHCAQRIQVAMTPMKKELKEGFDNHFVFDKARDIVSGDFYWYIKQGESAYLAVVDCTGHGVPGAFVSVIGFALLKQIISVGGETNPAKVLDLMHQNISQWLRQNDDENQGIWRNRDGMDMALIRIDKGTQEIHYAGARNSIFIAQNNELEEFRGNRQSIGGAVGSIKMRSKRVPFTEQVIPIQKGAWVYLSSDGFFDQFGGVKNRKYSKKRFIETLKATSKNNAVQQHKDIEKSFEDWRADRKQIDDVLVIGIQL